jgi:hypothetical protein
MRKKTSLLYNICMAVIVVIIIYFLIYYIFGITIHPRLYIYKEGYEEVVNTTYETNSKIKVFTYASEMKETLQVLLESLKRNGYSYEVVGYGKPWSGFRNRMSEYLNAVKSYKEKVGGNELAVIIDGYDCISIKDSQSVYNTFVNRTRNNSPIMFGVEIVCNYNCNKNIVDWYDYHDIYGGKESIENMYIFKPDGIVSEKPVFLNAGMLIGRIEPLEKMYTGMLELNIEDDQIAAGTYLLQHMDDIDLDIEESIFRNKPGDKSDTYLDDEGKPHGPGFLHFPGNALQNSSVLTDIYSKYTLK